MDDTPVIIDDDKVEFEFDLSLQDLSPLLLTKPQLTSVFEDMNSVVQQCRQQIAALMTPATSTNSKNDPNGYIDLTSQLTNPLQTVLKLQHQIDNLFISLYNTISTDFHNELDAQYNLIQKAQHDVEYDLFQSGTLTPLYQRIQTIISTHSQFYIGFFYQLNSFLQTNPHSHLFFTQPTTSSSTTTTPSSKTGISTQQQSQQQQQPPQQQSVLSITLIQKMYFLLISFISFVETIYKNQSIILSIIHKSYKGIKTSFHTPFTTQLPPNVYFNQLLTFALILIPPQSLPENAITFSTQTQTNTNNRRIGNKKTSQTTMNDGDDNTTTTTTDGILVPGQLDTNPSAAESTTEQTEIDTQNQIDADTQLAIELHNELNGGGQLSQHGQNSNIFDFSSSTSNSKSVSKPPIHYLSFITSRLHSCITFRPSSTAIYNIDINQSRIFIPYNLQTNVIDEHFIFLQPYSNILSLAQQVDTLELQQAQKPKQKGRKMTPYGFNDNDKNNDPSKDGTESTLQFYNSLINLPMFLLTTVYRVSLLFSSYNIAFVMGTTIYRILSTSISYKSPSRHFGQNYVPEKNQQTMQFDTPNAYMYTLSLARDASARKNSIQLLQSQLFYLGIITGLIDVNSLHVGQSISYIRQQQATRPNAPLIWKQTSIFVEPPRSLLPIYDIYNILLSQQLDIITKTILTAKVNGNEQIGINDTNGDNNGMNDGQNDKDGVEPKFGMSILPSVITEITTQATLNEATSTPTTTPVVSTQLLLQQFMNLFTCTNVKSTQYNDIMSLFPPHTTPFSLLFVNNGIDTSVQQYKQTTIFEQFYIQPHLFYIFQTLLHLIYTQFKSMYLINFCQLFQFVINGGTNNQNQYKPITIDDFQQFLNIYTKWVQNTANYPHPLLSTTNNATNNINTKNIDKISSSLNIFTHNPIYILPTIECPSTTSTTSSQTQMDANNNNTSSITYDHIIHFNLIQSRTISTVGTLAATNLAMKSHSYQKTIYNQIQTTIELTNEYLQQQITKKQQQKQQTIMNSGAMSNLGGIGGNNMALGRSGGFGAGDDDDNYFDMSFQGLH